MLSRLITLFTLLFLNISICHAAEYKLGIQPILPEKELKTYYQPLADYLSKQTGHKITIATQRNFIYYWHNMRKQKKGFDLVLDAAHFTGYRTKNLGYTALAKLPDTVSFAIVTKDDNSILDIEELISKKIATMPSPSLGSVRLEQLFPNPMQIPEYIWEINASVAVASVLSGKVDAAIVPTRLASGYDGLNTVVVTEPVPHMALSASPNVPPEVAKKIREALIYADKSSQGRAMLATLKVDKFEATDNKTYDEYSALLKNVHGYKAKR